MNIQSKSVLEKNWKANLMIKICLANVAFPLLFLILNQVFIRYFALSAAYTFDKIVISPIDAGVLTIYLVSSLVSIFFIYIVLKPLFSFIEKRTKYAEARVATLQIPWLLIVLHLLLWIVGPTFYYWKVGWKPFEGMNYIWALLTDISTGLLSVICVILAINNSLSRIKMILNITDMRAHEWDSFIKYRNYIVNGAILLYALIHNGFIANFYYIYGIRHGRTAITFLPFIIFDVFLVVLAGVILYFSRRDHHFQVDMLKAKLDELTGGSTLNLSERIILVNFDEMGEVCMKINQFLNSFTGILQKAKDAGTLLADSANSLLASSTEIATISNEQSNAIKQVVATVEESDRAVNAMDIKIYEMADLIKEDEEAIGRGFTFIQESLKNMDDIKASHNTTIQGIRYLGEQIESIWDIVRIINSIADQTKIIAFNAELEAMAAGEAGRNFQIVASEIRRLAEKTGVSTKEIKARIDEIQNASDSLVRSSEMTTNYIKEEWELANNIGKIFGNIRKSTEISTSSSQQIITRVNQVVTASNQILRTLRQINSGIENFVSSTRFTSDSAQKLKKMADSLNKIVATYAL